MATVRILLMRHANPALRVPATMLKTEEVSGVAETDNAAPSDPSVRELVGAGSTRYGLVHPDRYGELKAKAAAFRTFVENGGNPDRDPAANVKNLATGQLIYLDSIARQGDATLGLLVRELLNKGEQKLDREFRPDVVLTSEIARTSLSRDSMLKHYSDMGEVIDPIMDKDGDILPAATKPLTLWKTVHKAVSHAMEARPGQDVDVILILHDALPGRALSGAGIEENPPHYYGAGHPNEWPVFAPLASGYLLRADLQSADELLPVQNEAGPPDIILPARNKIEVIRRVQPYQRLADAMRRMSGAMAAMEDRIMHPAEEEKIRIPRGFSIPDLKLANAEMKKLSDFVQRMVDEDALEVDSQILKYLYCNDHEDKAHAGMTRLFALSTGLSFLRKMAIRSEDEPAIAEVMQDLGETAKDKQNIIDLVASYAEVNNKSRIIDNLYHNPQLVLGAQRRAAGHGGPPENIAQVRPRAKQKNGADEPPRAMGMGG